MKIEFYFDEHPPPHFHAPYAEFIAQVDIASLEIIKGSLPAPQLQTVREWAGPRREQLQARGTHARPAEVTGHAEARRAGL